MIRAIRVDQEMSPLDVLVGVEPPWRIDHVDLDVAALRVEVWVAPASPPLWPCPEYGVNVPPVDHVERTWRHRDLCQFRMLIHATVPRVACPRHAVNPVRVSWAGAGSGYTSAMERWILDVTEHSGVSEAGRLLQIDWTEALRLMLSRRVGI